jgi:signal transduction histidine kinase
LTATTPAVGSRNRARGDAIAAGLLFAAGSLLIGLGSFERYMADLPMWLRFVPLALTCLGVVIRRAAPGWCLAIGTVGFCMEVGIGLSLATACVFTDNLYAFARYGPRRKVRVLAPVVALLVLGLGVFSVLEGGSLAAVLTTLAIAAVVLLSPIATGIIVRQAHDRANLEAERAEQATRLADVRRRDAVLRERTIMARELHDTVANYLSAIALQSTALQARKDLDAETVRTSVAAIRSSSVEGLAELRRIIGLLRAGDEGEELASYRIDQVPDLVERIRAVGLKVDFEIEGAQGDLPGEVELTVYRLVQEALTNALKYGSDASVVIGFEAERLTVRVENALNPEADPVPGGGAGLVGMTERVRLLGGKVHAGLDGTRWKVCAAIPTGGNGG